MAISRESIPRVERRREEVHCEPLGGAVIVQGMDLPQLLAFNDARRAVRDPLEGESEAQRESRAMNTLMPMVLAMCVLADDGEPVYTEDEWRVWCAMHIADGYDLFAACTRAGSAEAQKKT